MKKIKIAHFVNALDGGAANVILNYSGNMPDNYEFFIISENISSELYIQKFISGGWKIIRIPDKKHPFRYYRALKRIIRDNSIDIAHCHMTLTNIFTIYLLKKCGCKIRISHSHLASSPENSFKDRFLAYLSRKFLNKITTVNLACGQDAGMYLYGNSGFTVLKNAIDTEKYRFDEKIRRSGREKTGFSGKLIMGNVGRFVTQKNHRKLIEIYAQLEKYRPDSLLLLIGDGPLTEEIRKYCEQKGISDKVIFTGETDNIAEKLQAMDIFVLPSLCEGLPLSVIEAQAAGLPCILSTDVTREAGLSENTVYLSTEQTADYWVKKIMELSKSVRKDGTAILKAKGYDIKTEACKLDKIYMNLLSQHSGNDKEEQ